MSGKEEASLTGTPDKAGHDSGGPLSSPWVMMAIVFLVLVLAAGTWVIASGRAKGGREGGTPTAASSVSAAETAAGAGESTGSDAGASMCGLAAGDQQVPVQAPAGGTETVAPGLQVPVVDGVGPAIRSGISRCFAHSPSGAVVGAVNWIKWFSSQQRLPEVITTLMAEGNDRDRLARQVDDGWDGSTSSPVGVEGFKVDVRSTNEVVVTLAVSSSTGRGGAEGLVSWPVVLRWEAGDWKVVAPASNTWGQEPVASLVQGGFTEWRI